MDVIINFLGKLKAADVMENKIFCNALIVSIVVHCLAVGILSIKRFKQLKKQKPIEISYQNVKVEKKSEKEIKTLKLEKTTPALDDFKIISKHSPNFTPVGEKSSDYARLSTPTVFKDRPSENIKTFEGKRKISIPVLKSEKISNPKYLSYNESIRQKIKQRAYDYVDHPEFQPGQVYLTFVLGSDGTLTAIKVIDERTEANSYLRSVGVRSIQESSPFPPFPPEFNYPELTFNVVISFEVEE